jgi:hypothetical protein
MSCGHVNTLGLQLTPFHGARFSFIYKVGAIRAQR